MGRIHLRNACPRGSMGQWIRHQRFPAKKHWGSILEPSSVKKQIGGSSNEWALRLPCLLLLCETVLLCFE